MTCLVIEDEKIAAERMVQLIKKCNASAFIVGVLPSIQQAVNWFQSNPMPDVAFMDIQLSDGLSFEIFELVEVTCPVIFTTAYNEYTLKAFKVNSIDYLLKPIDEEELCQAMAKYERIHKPINISKDTLNAMVQSLGQKYKERFAIKVGEHIRLIQSNEIQCFYSMEKAVFLQTINGRDYAVNQTLDELEQLLDPSGFFRISRKHIIALHAIKDILNYSNSRLLVKLYHPNDDCLVSRERVKLFKAWLEQ